MNTVEKEYGKIDNKGYWSPSEPCGFAPLFQWPVKPVETLKWLFGWGGYIWPRHAAYVLLSVITWYFFQSDLSGTEDLSASWIALMLLRNLILMIGVYGFYHVTLYILKAQGTKGKYCPKGQEKTKKFLFNDQVKDNMFRSLVTRAPIWTAWEVFYIWAAANGKMPLISLASNPIWFVAFFFIIPLWRETHFYFIHRLIHWKPLLRAIHNVHHKNPNPGPWSGMSMHPIEQILYLSVVLIHFVVPGHPIHFLFNSQLTALTPAQGHTGFEGPYFKDKWPAGDYFHYLHHRYVSCSFGGGTVPWDKWLGRYFDGEGPYKTKR